jgi:hypothetical protein
MNYKEMELEKLNHLLSLGYTLPDIEKMSEVEVEEHCWTKEDAKQAWDEMIDSRGQF